MKRIITLAFIAFTIIMANSQIVKPDFAHPKTTAQNASKVLKTAVANKDAASAINALMVYCVAEDEIDWNEIQNSIKLVDMTRAEFKDSSLSGIFDALLARLYYAAYLSNRWKYDQRNLPLEPLPDDITEWSGDQYCKKISELCLNSIDIANVDRLRKLPITSYPDIVECNEQSAQFFPTMADFAYQNVASISRMISRPTGNMPIDSILTSARDGSTTIAAKIQWQCQLDKLCDNQYEAFVNDYIKYADNEASALILGMMYDQLSDETQKTTFKELATEYLTRYPSSDLRAFVEYDLKKVLLKNVSIDYNDMCASGNAFMIDIRNYNANKYKINAYFVGEKDINDGGNTQKRYKQIIATSKPVVSIDMSNDLIAPFKEDTTAKMSLDRPGYYLIVPQCNDSQDEYGYLKTIRCTPLLPITILNSDENKVRVVVANSLTGKPISGAAVYSKTKNSRISFGKTDADGMLEYKYDPDSRMNGLVIDYDGKSYTFDNVSVKSYQTFAGERDEKRTIILTDRAIYHPGEEVNVLGVFYENISKPDKTFQKNLISGKEVRFMLRNANFQPIDTVTATTDAYGRATAKFTLPTDGLTGNFTIYSAIVEDDYDTGNRQIMVSDYRMPEFELNINAIECDTLAKGQVTITGDATSYSGMPMSDMSLNVIVRKSDWWWRSNYGETVYNTEISTDSSGKYSLVIPDSAFTGDKASLYAVTIDAVSATGATATATQSFSLSEKYFISANVESLNVNGELPLTPEVKVTTADGTQVEISLQWSLEFKNETIASGPYYGSIDLSEVKPGQYTLSFSAKEKELANVASCDIVIYNVSSGIAPDRGLWLKQDSYKLTDSNVIDIDLATGDEVKYVYYSLVANGEVLYTKVKSFDYGYHTMSIEIPEDIEDASLKMMYVYDCKVSDRSISIDNKVSRRLKIVGESFRDNLVPGAMETWNLSIVNNVGSPVEAAVALDMYNKSLDAIYAHIFDLYFFTYGVRSNVYYSYPSNYTTSIVLSDKIRQDFRYVLAYPVFNNFDNSNRIFKGRFNLMLSVGDANIYGNSDGVVRLRGLNSLSARVKEDVEEEAVVTGYGAAKMMAPMADGVLYNTAPVHAADDGAEYEVVEDEVEMTKTMDEAFDYRDSEVPLCVWAPSLTTDAQGNVHYSFSVPNANTTWRLRAVAWSKDMEIGSMMRDFVASKPVMVQPNLPRFLRVGDKATVLASVMNNTDSVADIATVVEIFNPFTSEVIAAEKFNNSIEAKQSATVSIEIYAPEDLNAIGYRVRSSNGQFSDGEQNVIRILPSLQSLIETTPFYLNPGETRYTTQLPSETEARISLTFCENPAWSIVSALPGLRTQICDYANSAAAALYSAAIAKGILKSNPAIGNALKQWTENPTDSALVSMLQKNEDLKIALLNSTPWVQAAQSDTERMANLQMIFDNDEVQGSINAAIKILEKLQKSDGGWAWGTWCDESSVWVTSNVLAMLGDLKRLGWLPENKSLDRLIEKAVKYYDKNVEDTDLLYCLIRPAFSNISVSSNGKKVINATLADIRSHWKKTMDPAYKTMEAEALYLNGDKDTALKLMASVSEFGVFTPNQGLKFPSVNGLYDYSILLEGYAMMLPDSKEVDGLRQQLIIRKQGTDWGDAVVTTQVVKSILSSGTTWTVDAKGAEIKVGNDIIEPKGAIETATGALTADLSQYAGDMLTVTTTGVGPAYGAVYAQFSKQMDEVKASACDDLDIEKQLFVRRGADWEVAEDLKVGDRVKVQLTIHCKRNLNYVSIIDERPATFEPVNQIPGWLWSEGVGFYRENRDSQTDLHVVYMRPGTYLLTYEMNVNLGGKFSSGVASIQSQYAPEISAHSSGCTIKISSK